jgi:hypothetical protein
MLSSPAFRDTSHRVDTFRVRRDTVRRPPSADSTRTLQQQGRRRPPD